MADHSFDNFESGYRTSNPLGGVGRAVTLGGAAVSVALILGLGVWSYNLAMRDVAGIPVIRALDGPLRLAPQEPGGQEADHQGLSVNAVAAAGTALPLPETLILAPRALELAADDTPGLVDLAPVDPPEEVLAAVAPAEPSGPAVLEAASLPDALPETQQDAVALALAEALGADVSDIDTQSDTTALAGGTSPRPKSRSANIGNVEQVSAQMPAPSEVDPSEIAAGTRLAQLGAFEDQDAARAEWARLTNGFGDLMEGKSMVVQAAQSGGRTFYRLRAHGFADEDEARRFCTAMLAENATCIPVAQR